MLWKNRPFVLALGLMLALLSSAVCAQSASQEALEETRAPTLELETDSAWRYTGLTVYWDNDGAFIKPWNGSDKHYSNGVKIELTWQPRFDADWREWIAPAGEWADAELAFGVVLSQHIYTATDIRVVSPPLDDRPYAGYLYAGAFIQRATETVHDHLELDLGIVGPGAGGEPVQKFVHAVAASQFKPRGWGTQLGNEFAVNLRYGRSWKSEKADLGGIELDAIPRIGFDLGNVFTRANADITLRLGLGLPENFGPGRMLDYRDATGGRSGGWASDRDWNVYGFARLGGRGVAHNIFLDGNTFEDSRSVDREPFVGEVELGLRARCGRWEAGYSITWMTKEYETQESVEAFGSWVVTMRF